MIALIPEALVATIPPIVQASPLPGAVGEEELFRCQGLVQFIVDDTCLDHAIEVLDPHFLLILSILVICMTMPPNRGTAPPHRPVPPPRAVIGTLYLAANLTIADTSAEVLGRTTTSGLA